MRAATKFPKFSQVPRGMFPKGYGQRAPIRVNTDILRLQMPRPHLREGFCKQPRLKHHIPGSHPIGRGDRATRGTEG